jgi:hypothetical protein
MRRRTPPLACDSALSGAWRLASAGLGGLVVGVLVRWLSALGGLDEPYATAGSGLAALCVAATAWRGLPVHPRRLFLSGDGWRVRSAPPFGAIGRAAPIPGRPTIALDLGAWMLVRFDTTPSRRFWLPLSESPDPGRWSALRAALWTWRPEAPPPPAAEGPGSR